MKEGEVQVKYEEIALDSVEVREERVRQTGSVEAMEGLKGSIREKGMLVPIVVVEEGEGYRLIAGSRRVLCARSLGLVRVPAMIVEAEQEWLEWAALAENREREALNAYDEARYVFGLVTGRAGSQSEVARVLGVSESWVSQRLAILDWPDDVKEALVERKIPYAVGRELAAITADDDRAMYVHQAAVSGCTARQAVQWRKSWEASLARPEQLPVQSESEKPPPPVSIVPSRCYLCGQSGGGVRYLGIELCEVCLQSLSDVRAKL